MLLQRDTPANADHSWLSLKITRWREYMVSVEAAPPSASHL
jgi:hypothetical protein